MIYHSTTRTAPISTTNTNTTTLYKISPKTPFRTAPIPQFYTNALRHVSFYDHSIKTISGGHIPWILGERDHFTFTGKHLM
jgi:hypothetical protein